MIAIIGAGIAGLSAARTLIEQGHKVCLFDKGRGPGGRLSTRRVETAFGQAHFDHGAQYFTPTSEAFGRATQDWLKRGVVDIWQGQHRDMRETPKDAADANASYYTGAPSMNAIIKDMANGLDVTWAKRVLQIEAKQGSWSLKFEHGGIEGPFTTVILAVPIEQARPFYEQLYAGAVEPLAKDTYSVPCWAYLAAFDSPLTLDWVSYKPGQGPFAWIAHNRSKSGRTGPDTLVAHANLDWSIEHLEKDKAWVTEALQQALAELIEIPTPIYSASHRWRYSQVTSHEWSGIRWDEARRVGFCGDWSTGPKLEDAWLSGQKIAFRIQGL